MSRLDEIIFEEIENITKINDNFWRWFGDSKVVDKNGQPMICYHGTPKGGFTEFKPKVGYKGRSKQQLDLGSHFSGDKDYASTYSKNGKKSKIYECFLKIENPLHVNLLLYKEDDEVLFNKYLNFITDTYGKKFKLGGDFYYDKNGNKQESIQMIILNRFMIDTIPSNKLYNGLIKHGFDGVFHEPYNREGLQHFKEHPQAYVVLFANQIKSVNNNGEWNINNNNIYYE